MKSAGPRSLKARALQWLAQREHSRLELQRKLMPLAEAEDAAMAVDVAEAAVQGPGPDAGAMPRAKPGHLGRVNPVVPTSEGDGRLPAAARVDELLDWLEAHRYLSEQRFAESRVHARSARFGNLRIRQELAQHGVVLTDEARQALQGSELERARSVWERKFARSANAAAPDAGDRARQARFLTARGFSPEVVRQVLREATAGVARRAVGQDDEPG